MLKVFIMLNVIEKFDSFVFGRRSLIVECRYSITFLPNIYSFFFALGPFLSCYFQFQDFTRKTERQGDSKRLCRGSPGNLRFLELGNMRISERIWCVNRGSLFHQVVICLDGWTELECPHATFHNVINWPHHLKLSADMILADHLFDFHQSGYSEVSACTGQRNYWIDSLLEVSLRQWKLNLTVDRKEIDMDWIECCSQCCNETLCMKLL